MNGRRQGGDRWTGSVFRVVWMGKANLWTNGVGNPRCLPLAWVAARGEDAQWNDWEMCPASANADRRDKAWSRKENVSANKKV